MSSFMRFWGKAQPSETATHSWHPAALHGLDVAAVASMLLRRAPASPAAMARLCGWSSGDFVKAVVFLIALHDIGKFSRPFQAKAPAHWPFAPPVAALSGPHHDAVGLALLLGEDHALDSLEAVTPGWREEDRASLAKAVAGHHGRPAEECSGELSAKVVCEMSSAVARGFADAVAALLEPPGLQPPKPGTAAILSWWLAGLTTLCDWIGSAQAWFPYAGDSVSRLEDYWQQTLAQAAIAVTESGIVPVAAGQDAGVAGLMPRLPPLTPTPMQALAERVMLPAGPLCLILEDATGGGKTEAALVLAQRMISEGRADGLFIGLPTMATADAMYGRLNTAYRRLFAPEAEPSLALAHGHARLHDLFRGTILLKAGDGSKAGDGENDADETASAQCAAWLAAEGRRVFLSHVGVGTIDQALLAVLPARYAALRLFGLCRKVLIVDEAHSYDAYMGEELQRLLTFHAALGGSSIVLSATLPLHRRAALLRAFAAGLDVAPLTPKSTAYPLMTVAAGTGGAEYPAPMRKVLERDLPVRRLGSIEEAVMALAEASRAGACGIWVRNTVDDARAGAEALAAAGVKQPILFHARFAMGDRLRIQAEVLHLFGPGSAPAERAPGGDGRVLVATQVVEQSLDLDADVMVSDLAPIDLLIQRAGRLHRHPDRTGRPDVSRWPELLVVSPDPVAAPDEAWARDAAIGGSRFVYAPHVLWLSAIVLFGTGRIVTPDGVRSLVEGVYGPEAQAVPPGLAREAERAMGKTGAQLGLARTNLLELAAGYCRGSGSGGKWETDVRMFTRLGDDYVTFRMAREERGELVAWAAGQDNADKAWALSEIALRRSLATAEATPAAPTEAALRHLRSGWKLWEKDIPVLILRRDGDAAWVADALQDKAEVRLGYSAERGLWRF